MDKLFWNSNNGHICEDRPCSPQSVPIIGYFTGNEKISVIQWITTVQETGLDLDSYSELPTCQFLSEEEVKTSTDHKRAILADKKREKPIYYLSDVYKGIIILTLREFVEKSHNFYENGRVFSHSSFLPCDTPSEFNYTVSGN